MSSQSTEQAIFGAGCFWGVEHEFRQVPGVISTEVGYSGGRKADPTYKDVCTDTTGHAEVVRVTFDTSVVGFPELLEVFWANHDPTQMNRQGPDYGSQYRSAVFYLSEEQRIAAEERKKLLQDSGKFQRKIVTEITAAGPFYLAEDYHQQYLEKRGLPSCHISSPK